jgi:hypothetical protein
MLLLQCNLTVFIKKNPSIDTIFPSCHPISFIEKKYLTPQPKQFKKRSEEFLIWFFTRNIEPFYIEIPRKSISCSFKKCDVTKHFKKKRPYSYGKKMFDFHMM